MGKKIVRTPAKSAIIMHKEHLPDANKPTKAPTAVCRNIML